MWRNAYLPHVVSEVQVLVRLGVVEHGSGLEQELTELVQTHPCIVDIVALVEPREHYVSVRTHGHGLRDAADGEGRLGDPAGLVGVPFVNQPTFTDVVWKYEQWLYFSWSLSLGNRDFLLYLFIYYLIHLSLLLSYFIHHYYYHISFIITIIIFHLSLILSYFIYHYKYHISFIITIIIITISFFS